MMVTPESTAAAMAAPVTVERAAADIVLRPVHSVPAVIGRLPRWLRLIDDIHRAARSPIALTVDFFVIAASGIAAGVKPAIAAGLAAGFVIALYLAGKYTDRSPLETQGLIWYASQTVIAVAIATLIGVAVAHGAGLDIGVTLRFGAVAAGGLVALRLVTWTVIAAARRRNIGLRRTLIVGHSAPARMLSNKLTAYPEAGLVPVAMLPMGNSHGFARLLPEFPNAMQLATVIRESSVDHVILAPDGNDEAILECVKGSEGLEVSFSILPPLSEFFLHPTRVAQVGGLPLIPLGKIAQRRPTQPGKRLFDIVFASIALIALSPVFAIVAGAIRMFDGPQVIFRQRRVGRYGKTFSLMKFRSMVPTAERLEIDLTDRSTNMAMLFKLRDAPRITPIGRFIRRTAIDELPQLWNVIRGEMSLVGPRPTPGVNPEDFNAIDNKRHTVRPGITGYWQVSGDNALTWEEMVKLDLAYVENWSLWLDLLLMFRTVPALLHRLGPS